MNTKQKMLIANRLITIFFFIISECVCLIVLFKDIGFYRGDYSEEPMPFLIARSVLRIVAVAYMLSPVLFEIKRKKFFPVIIMLGVCELLYFLFVLLPVVFEQDWEGYWIFFASLYTGVFLPLFGIAFTAAVLFLRANRKIGVIISLLIYYAVSLALYHEISHSEIWETEIVASVGIIILFCFSIGCLQKENRKINK